MASTANSERYQLISRICRDAVGILLSGAGGDQKSVLYRVGIKQKYCSYPLARNVYFSRDNNGRIKKNLVKYCEKRSCPWCCWAIALEQKKRIKEVCAEWTKRGGYWQFWTFTIPHNYVPIVGSKNLNNAQAHWKECDLLLEMTWRAFSQTYRNELVDSLGLVSQLRRSESTFGGSTDGRLASYHPHLHVLPSVRQNMKLERKPREGYTAYTKRQAAKNLEISMKLFTAFEKSMHSVLKKHANLFPSIIRRQKKRKTILRAPYIEAVKRTIRDRLGRRRKIIVWIVKGAVTGEVPYGNTTDAIEAYLAAEVTYSHAKKGKGPPTDENGNDASLRSYSWLEALELHADKKWCQALYQHWVKRIHRRSTYEWGTVSVPGDQKRLSFETFLKIKENFGNQTEATPKVIGAISAERYLEESQSGRLAEALDEAETAGSDESLLEVGVQMANEQQDMFEIERNLRRVREVAGLIKKSYYDHGTVKKHAPPFVLLAIDMVKVFQQKLAEADFDQKNLYKWSLANSELQLKHRQILQEIGFLVRMINKATKDWLLAKEIEARECIEAHSQEHEKDAANVL